ncbi:uncharacterized protein LOC125502199 [Athalia rosae]|uniref:uncharacterized protein LOC125502199 n=1 Tax=Athalia rosae TaxID=37344 RepID=UPI0020338B63|nr:uncharacterized protein LOC125502199 [Athalia rosae]
MNIICSQQRGPEGEGDWDRIHYPAPCSCNSHNVKFAINHVSIFCRIDRRFFVSKATAVRPEQPKRQGATSGATSMATRHPWRRERRRKIHWGLQPVITVSRSS